MKSNFKKYSKISNRERYAEITDRLVQSIMNYVNGDTEYPPWIRPWKTLGPLRNPVTGSTYRGFNIVILSTQPYDDPRWVTAAGAKKLNGHIKKGEKVTYIRYYSSYSLRKDDEEEDGKIGHVVKFFPVFNVEQCNDLKLDPIITGEYPSWEEHGKAEKMISLAGPSISFGGSKASYSPMLDVIKMPEKNQFSDESKYYATFMHELIHSTGHKKRENRDLSTVFGSKEYAFEELIAEFGAAFLCSDLKIDGYVQHAEYLRSWLKKLGNDPNQLLQASQLASRAAFFLCEKSGNNNSDGTKNHVV